MVGRAFAAARDDDPLFVKDGTPVRFCFHRSVTQGRGQITRDVERNGGEIVQDERCANVLLVDEQEDLDFIRRRYYSSTEVYRLELYVEPRGFVQTCVRSGTYMHVPPAMRGMPGRPQGVGGGRGRVSFTKEDREHLAYYIATRFPTRDGRMGNKAYKELELLGQTDDPSWAWAGRHTWHSWREHYKVNTARMDPRINYYLDRLKNIGHHFGHDMRRHDFRRLIRERENEDEREEEGEEEPWQGIRRQGSERREQARPAVFARRRQGHLARREQDLSATDDDDDDSIQLQRRWRREEEEEEEEISIQEPQRAKRHRDAHPQHDVQETRAKRARVSEAEASPDETVSPREADSNNEDSQGIEGSDLFGDRAYEDDEGQETEFPSPLPPRASPAPEPDDAPFSTQATLIASPLTTQREREKEPTPAPGPSPTKVIEAQAPTSESTVPTDSQPSAVATRERVVVQRARVRGASAQPGPSVSRETRTRDRAPAADAPYRNTRARSRSVERQSQTQSTLGFQRMRQRDDQRGRGKGKARDEELVTIEEDGKLEEEPGTYAGESVAATNGLATRETFEDEMAVEGLLEESGGEDTERDEDDRISDVDEDEDLKLPPFQDVEIESDPSDSDDAETHVSLVRGAVREVVAAPGSGDTSSGWSQRRNRDLGVREGSGARGESKSHAQDQIEDSGSDSDDADADRIERMARGSLRVAPTPAPTPREPRITRSMAGTRTQTQFEPRTDGGPRRKRSSRAKAQSSVFPSPGTKARAMVDRFQEEGKQTSYEPPEGSRAAKAVKGKGRRGL